MNTINTGDLEEPRGNEKYVGKRVKRGLFRSSTGKVINTDINGSLQIIRKKFPEAFIASGNSELRRTAYIG